MVAACSLYPVKDTLVVQKFFPKIKKPEDFSPGFFDAPYYRGLVVTDLNCTASELNPFRCRPGRIAHG